MRHFFESWKCLSSDPWIVQSISQEVKFDFLTSPFQVRSRTNMELEESQWTLCNQEIQDLVKKEAIEPIEDSGQCFVSGVFIIPKKSGGFRPIVNLNGFLTNLSFPLILKGIAVVHFRRSFAPTTFFYKIDLKDAYLTVLLHQEDRKFIQIMWEGQLYQFKTLAFGLASAPFYLQKF